MQISASIFKFDPSTRCNQNLWNYEIFLFTWVIFHTINAHYKKVFTHILYFNFQSFPLKSKTTVLGILSQGVYNPTTTMYYFLYIF